MAYTMEEFRTCFYMGKVYLVVETIAPLKCIGRRIRKRKDEFYADEEHAFISVIPNDSVKILSVGDLIFRRARDGEVSVMMPGIHIPHLNIIVSN